MYYYTPMPASTRLCYRCGKRKPLRGSTRVSKAQRGTGKFVCADCSSHQRVISGCGETTAERKMTEALIRALKVSA